jgi:hypothetical protein
MDVLNDGLLSIVSVSNASVIMPHHPAGGIADTNLGAEGIRSIARADAVPQRIAVGVWLRPWLGVRDQALVPPGALPHKWG